MALQSRSDCSGVKEDKGNDIIGNDRTYLTEGRGKRNDMSRGGDTAREVVRNLDVKTFLVYDVTKEKE